MALSSVANAASLTKMIMFGGLGVEAVQLSLQKMCAITYSIDEQELRKLAITVFEGHTNFLGRWEEQKSGTHNTSVWRLKAPHEDFYCATVWLTEGHLKTSTAKLQSVKYAADERRSTMSGTKIVASFLLFFQYSNWSSSRNIDSVVLEDCSSAKHEHPMGIVTPNSQTAFRAYHTIKNFRPTAESSLGWYALFGFRSSDCEYENFGTLRAQKNNGIEAAAKEIEQLLKLNKNPELEKKCSEKYMKPLGEISVSEFFSLMHVLGANVHKILDAEDVGRLQKAMRNLVQKVASTFGYFSGGMTFTRGVGSEVLYKLITKKGLNQAINF